MIITISVYAILSLLGDKSASCKAHALHTLASLQPSTDGNSKLQKPVEILSFSRIQERLCCNTKMGQSRNTHLIVYLKSFTPGDWYQACLFQ